MEPYELAKPFGRPRKFKTAEELWTAFQSYVKWNNENPMKLTQTKEQSQGTRGDMKRAYNQFVEKPLSLIAFRFHADIKRDWATFKADYVKRGEGFRGVINAIEECIREQQVSNALVGNYKENLVARLNGIQDSVKQEVKADVQQRTELSVEEAKAFMDQLNKEI